MLVTVRCRVLRAANLLPDDAPLPEVECQTRAYYRKAFAEDTHTAYLVWDGDTLVGTGAVSYFQVMPTVHNPTGQKAYIMNMYTVPQYRRQGVAAHTLALLVEDAHRRGVRPSRWKRPRWAGRCMSGLALCRWNTKWNCRKNNKKTAPGGGENVAQRLLVFMDLVQQKPEDQTFASLFCSAFCKP